MTTPLETLIATGTKLWLDSVDPDLVRSNRKIGATGATSNPVIISGLLKGGRFDDRLQELMNQGLSDEEVAWATTDELVRDAQGVFAEVYEATGGDDGYVSFELDPLIDAADSPLSHQERIDRYVALAKQWGEGHRNRMIKVPGTPAGIDALEEIVAAGITVNVTLLFTARQYEADRTSLWKGAQRRSRRDGFKSVYSIFISRIDVYTKDHLPELSDAVQGLVGTVNAKQIWQQNQAFWADKNLPLSQEIIFASTGTKDPADSPDKYVAALAGSDIQTNPPGINADIQQMAGKVFSRTVDQMPPQSVLDEIAEKVDMQQLEDVLMEEGLQKFADPQKQLLSLIAEKRAALKVG